MDLAPWGVAIIAIAASPIAACFAAIDIIIIRSALAAKLTKEKK